MTTPPLRWVLFGAFDRHNLGDLLMPHVLATLLPGRELVFAGLAPRDLRPVGGHEVQALADVARACEAEGRDAVLLHVGGEVLTTTAWQAAAMLLPPDQAQATIGHLEARPAERDAWVVQRLGGNFHAPYAEGARRFRSPPRVGYVAAGGVHLSRAGAEHRQAVAAALHQARAVTVRDHLTLTRLRAEGIGCSLLPDAGVVVAELFSGPVARHATRGEVAALRAAMPLGHLAVQCSAEFADDASLAALAERLVGLAQAQRVGLALMCAGTAPWHDDAAVLDRLAARLTARTDAPAVHRLHSSHLWDLCALIATSHGFVGSSLHGRIVAQAFGRPATLLRSPVAPTGPTKHEAYDETWRAAASSPPALFRAGFGALITSVLA